LGTDLWKSKLRTVQLTTTVQPLNGHSTRI
jgi:hypothetical protein